MNDYLHAVVNIIKDNCIFPKEFNKTDCDRVFAPLKEELENYYVDAGATKAVIIVKGLNQVIKIPFNCTVDTYFNETANDDVDYTKEFFAAALPDEDTSIEDYWDYCALESKLYTLAVKEGLGDYFAKEYCYDDCLPFPIYVQTRCEMLDEDSRYSEQELRNTTNTCLHLNTYCFNPYWITDFIQIYGEKEFKRLSDFLDKYEINDLHGGNLGYLDGLPVLVDYSSYREW